VLPYEIDIAIAFPVTSDDIPSFIFHLIINNGRK